MDLKVLPNVRKTCRTCLRVLESRKDLISIMSYDQTFASKQHKISEMLASVTSLKPRDDDPLPKRICIACLCQVRSAFFFKFQAENAHNTWLKQLKIDDEPTRSELKQEQTHDTTIAKVTNVEDNQQPAESSNPTENVDLSIENADDMLVEIEPPKIQEHFNGYGEEEEDSDDENAYEPENDHSDNEDVEMAYDDPNTKACNGKSPDSGISDECNKMFSVNFNERQLAESQLGDLLDYVCNICHKQMISRKALVRHKRTYHSEIKCNYCGRPKKFGNRFQLLMHVRFKHPQKFDEFRLNGQMNAIVQVQRIAEIPECEACSATFCDLNAVHRHRADCDKKCSECGLKIPQKNLYLLHMEQDHNIKLDAQSSLECPFGCSDNFFSQKVLQDHINRVHPEDKESSLECPFGCSDNFFSEKVLQDHINRVHPEDKESIADTISSEDGESVSSEASLECGICQHRFIKQKSLKQHIAIMHKGVNKEQMKFRHQPKYTRDEFVERFMVSKSSEFQHCLPCNKEINRKSLMVHLKTRHASIKCFRCELCPETFFRSDYRQRHMGYAHPTQFKCIRCECQFDRAYKFDAHMTKHGIKAKNFKMDEGLDRYDLPLSDMKFIEDVTTYDYSKKESPMQRRMSVLGPSNAQVEIPLTKEEFIDRYLVSISAVQSQCTICQQKIMKTSILTHLLWKHALQKPLKCAFCSERVVKGTGRLNHMARCHPNEYRCKDCNQQFAKHQDLALHMRDGHNKKLTTSPSSGEEPDLASGDVRFVSQKNEEEIIDETEIILMESEAQPVRKRRESVLVNERSYRCEPCNKSFSCSKNLLIHRSHKHKDYLGETSKAALLDYTDSMTFEEFRNHFSEDIGINNLKCLVCDQTLKKKNFPTHAKTRHATVGGFKCAVCPEAFFRPEHRMQHMSQTHRGMFFCQTCNIQFYRNSRYAKHMKDLHEIEMDGTDEYEVDACMIDMKFAPIIKKYQDEDSQPSIVHDLEPEAAETSEIGEGISRDDFLSQYIKIVNKDTRRCLACEKTLSKSSMYFHLMRYHATTPPFKCPFCDLRLERIHLRIRHLQIFHPDDYKCQTCGIQFQKHAPYVEHMLIEHNEAITTPKAEGEEKDQSTLDIKYQPYLSREDSYWQEEESTVSETSTSIAPRATSTPVPADGTFLRPTRSSARASTSQKSSFLKPDIKKEAEDPEPEYMMEHSIFGSDQPNIEKPPAQGKLQGKAQKSAQSNVSSKQVEYTYNEFKNRFVKGYDNLNVNCVPCARKILKTALSSHMRVQHAIATCYNCELCPQGFQRADYRARHMKFSHEDDFKCVHCDTQFYRSALYKQHMTAFHKMPCDIKELKTKDEIDVPLETMKYAEKLPEEMKILNGCPVKKWGRTAVIQRPIDPEAGGLTFKEFIAAHIETTGDRICCKACGPDTTVSKYNLKKHIKRCHATTQPFFCELCPEGFNKLDDRMKHMSEDHENDFKCVHCNEQFYISTDYVDHMKETHRVAIALQAAKKRSEIDVPLERLRFVAEKLRDDTLTTYKTSSDPKRNFDDIPDDVELTRAQLFGKFFRSIKGTGKTKCLACSGIFSSNNRLTHAYHNHATKRPFQCELCSKGFILRNKRIKHMGCKHRDTYKCTDCSLQFDRGYLYANHMLTEHQTTVEVPEVDETAIDVTSDLMRFTKKSTAISKLNHEAPPTSVTLSPIPSLTQGPVKCNDCQIEFDSSRAYRTHLRNQLCGMPQEVIKKEPEEVAPPPEPQFECDICLNKFLTATGLFAHRKFKHFRDSIKKPPVIDKEYTVDCDICDFKSHRRDYVENHIKQAHKAEFKCRQCKRTLSNYNYYMRHVHESHPKAIETLQIAHKCSECTKGFRTAENLRTHVEAKHRSGVSLPNFYCGPCGVRYNSAEGFELHQKNVYHIAMENFVENPPARGQRGLYKDIKIEPNDVEMKSVDEMSLLEEGTDLDPIERMLARKIQSSDEPPTKRARRSSLSTEVSTPSEEVNTPMSSRSTSPSSTKSSDPAASSSSTIAQPAAVNGDLNLEYMKYFESTNNIYKCLVCGKTKTVRKQMLHHLKQHDEVPTFSCDQCPEKFLFKTKYESHMKSHEAKDLTEEVQQLEEVSIEEHPRFQETAKAVVGNEIKCHICELSFKLTIMLNRHKSTWHADDNPDKYLTMSDQKAKKDEAKHGLTVIKLLKCKHCLEAFIKPSGLKEHLKMKHDLECADQLMELDEAQSSDEQKTGDVFPCEKCEISYKEKRFLENHQKFFCKYRQGSKDQVVNEQ